jgi:hypothetical protein
MAADEMRCFVPNGFDPRARDEYRGMCLRCGTVALLQRPQAPAKDGSPRAAVYCAACREVER